jgi:hypothetical protein
VASAGSSVGASLASPVGSSVEVLTLGASVGTVVASAGSSVGASLASPVGSSVVASVGSSLSPHPVKAATVSKQRQNKSAMMIGNPQPLNAFEQKNPSFEPRISKAIRIQRVVLLPWEQQFINNLLCFTAGDMYFVLPSVEGKCLRFFISNIS